jgi:hypothetical protein
MSRHHCTTVAVAALTFAAAAQAQNIIKNGSFENNSAGGTMFNMTNATFNATVNDATAFGAANEIDIMQGAPYGLAPVDGQYKLGIHKQSGGPIDAFSFDLTAGIVSGNSYTLDFWAHAATDFDPGTQPIEVGISTSASSFGTLVYTTGALTTGSWTNYTTNVIAPINASYVTVRSTTGQETWAHIDDFSFSVPAPGSLALLGAASLVCIRRRRA